MLLDVLSVCLRFDGSILRSPMIHSFCFLSLARKKLSSLFRRKTTHLPQTFAARP